MNSGITAVASRACAVAFVGALVFAHVASASAPAPSPADDRETVAALDRAYQDAVKRNDAVTMGRILHDDFVLVLGNGRTYTRADLLDAARTRAVEYERQDEDPGTQTVRVFGDAAIVTARLWIRYTANGTTADRRLWFSDTYVRTPSGWKYAFGQASLALPAADPAP